MIKHLRKMNDEIKTYKNKGIINYFKISSENIFFTLLSIFLFYLILSPKKFDNYISIFIFLIITVISSYFRIKRSYFIFFGLFLILCAIPFYIFINKNVGFRFLYYSIFFIFLFFLLNPFYRYLDNIEKVKKRYLLNRSYTIVLVIVLISLFGYIFGPSLLKAYSNYKESKILTAKEHYQEGLELFEKQDYKEAIEKFKLAISNDKKLTTAYYKLGESYRLNGEILKAEENFKKALKIDPEFANCYLSLAMLSEENNNITEAIENYKKAIEIDPSLSESLYRLGKIYYTQGEKDKAEEKFLELIKTGQTYPEAHFILGKIYYEKEEYKKALDQFYVVGYMKGVSEFELPEGENLENYIEESEKKLGVKEITQLQKSEVGVLSEAQEKILESAKNQLEQNIIYRVDYYQGGWPPEDEGTSVDVINRALLYAGYDLQELIYEDMLENKDDYPFYLHFRQEIDKNIDFRRTHNQEVFFKKFGLSLTTDLIVEDEDNLSQWKPGDIVFFNMSGDEWSDIVAMVSDNLSDEGVPLVITSLEALGEVSEIEMLLKYKDNICGHYRYPKSMVE